MRELGLFAGAGGGFLGSRILGWRTVCAVEIDPFCRQVLLARQRDGMLPKFPIWDDVRTFDGIPWRGSIDVVSGGFPCQDISAAGQGAGITGERSGLVFEMLRIVDEVRPAFVFAENSPQLRTKGLATIVERFISMGYVGRVGVLGAGHVGANHERKRMWIVAVVKGVGRGQGRPGRFATGIERQQQLPFQITDVANAHGATLRKQPGRRSGENGKSAPVAGITDWWSVPRFAGVDDGLADRMDRVKATGNGQVPAVAALAWLALTADCR